MSQGGRERGRERGREGGRQGGRDGCVVCSLLTSVGTRSKANEGSRHVHCVLKAQGHSSTQKARQSLANRSAQANSVVSARRTTHTNVWDESFSVLLPISHRWYRTSGTRSRITHLGGRGGARQTQLLVRAASTAAVAVPAANTADVTTWPHGSRHDLVVEALCGLVGVLQPGVSGGAGGMKM